MSKRTSKSKSNTLRRRSLLFTTRNYTIMGIGMLLVAIGFTAMYLENKVDGFISLFISPVVIIAGYAIVIYAIMTDKNGTGNSQNIQTSSN